MSYPLFDLYGRNNFQMPQQMPQMFNPGPEVIAHGDKVDDISKELNGAKIYLQKFMDSHDESYKELAKSELNNASILIKKGYSKLPGTSDKQKLKMYEEKHDEIMEQLKSM